MKNNKRLGVAFGIVAATLAFAISAYAIGFDAETVNHSVFVIYSGDAIGSGFAIDETHIITNEHVIDDETQIYIGTYEGTQSAAVLTAADARLDIAVLCVPNMKLVPLACADLSVLNIGDDLFAIGAPNSMAYTLTKGVVSSKSRTVGRQSYIQTDAAINAGNSGGPLLNDSGEVVGVNSYKLSDAEGIGLAIPIDTVLAYYSGLNLSGTQSPQQSQILTGDHQLPADESFATPEGSQSTDVGEPQEETSDLSVENGLTNRYVWICGFCLVCSVIANIILLLKLRKLKKDQKELQSNRTDFEIDLFDEGEDYEKK